jgi:ASC-1-like (ASCH) protein
MDEKPDPRREHPRGKRIDFSRDDVPVVVISRSEDPFSSLLRKPASDQVPPKGSSQKGGKNRGQE